jgi:ABC-type nickel/cobalt efflux system permease component RcnA
MEQFEGARGAIAAYALIGFGGLYALWGLWQARKGHSHLHLHANGSVHVHPHDHEQAAESRQHMGQPHDDAEHLSAHRRTFGALFIIFVLGPCEPLIPLLMVPAAQHSWWGIAAVAGAFGVVTIGVMLVTVTVGMLGLRQLRVPSLAKYGHALAGLALVVSGTAVQVLGI